MKCPRCEGLMVRDHCYDFLEGGQPFHVQTLRCISCGNIVDPLILQNRQLAIAQEAQARPSVYVKDEIESTAA